MPELAGLLLAAGAGTRYGRAKALVELDGEPLVLRAVRILEEGGCSRVTVVIGAEVEAVGALLPPKLANVVLASSWSLGMGHSLKAGLRALHYGQAAVVHLVDLPGVTPEVIARLAAKASPWAVARAAYDGVPGHPVLLGRRWWPEVAEAVSGDEGARNWLSARDDLQLVECGDIGNGHDVDRPEDLPS